MHTCSGSSGLAGGGGRSGVCGSGLGIGGGSGRGVGLGAGLSRALLALEDWSLSASDMRATIVEHLLDLSLSIASRAVEEVLVSDCFGSDIKDDEATYGCQAC